MNPIVVSSKGADLENSTWAFDIDKDTKVSKGEFVLIPKEEYEKDMWKHLENSYPFKDLLELSRQRQKEIKEGKNLITTYPIYEIYSIGKFYKEEDSDCGGCMTKSSEFRNPKRVAIDSDDGHVLYLDDDEDMKNIVEREDGYFDTENEILYSRVLDEYYYDVFQTFCFTRKDAEFFLERNKHNMSEAFIFVNHIPYQNGAMQQFLQILGDKW